MIVSVPFCPLMVVRSEVSIIGIMMGDISMGGVSIAAVLSAARGINGIIGSVFVDSRLADLSM